MENIKRIMVVDDSLIIRVNLKRLFQSHGYEVVAEASNGKVKTGLAQ